MLSATGSTPGALCHQRKHQKIVTQPHPSPWIWAQVARHWASREAPTEQRLHWKRQCIWCGHPTSYRNYPKLRKFLVDRTTSFNGSILMFVHSKGLQQSLALACRYITWQKTSHWEMPIFPTFLSGHWNVLECTAITGRSGLIRPLIISCVGNQGRSGARAANGSHLGHDSIAFFRGITQQNGEVAMIQWQTKHLLFDLESDMSLSTVPSPSPQL